MRRILITNDDGIASEGLRRLTEAALRFGEVCICAPDAQRSAASHAISLHGSVDAFPVAYPLPGVRAFSCTGTPADCVRIGVLNLMEGKADTVLSGINAGLNVATDLQYSGTAGAAFEGAFQGLPAIALSEDTGAEEVTDAYLPQILEELLNLPLGYGEIWNVNFPGCARTACKGILRGTGVSHGTVFRDTYDEVPLPEGGRRFTVHGHSCKIAEPGTDFAAVLEGFISVGRVRNIDTAR